MSVSPQPEVAHARAQENPGIVDAQCRICGTSGSMRHYEAKEMSFGLREQFRYFECFLCGCLQIAEFPPEMERYYPSSYYSLARNPSAREGGVRRLLRVARDRYAYSGKGALGRFLSHLFPYRFDGVREWLSRSGVTAESRILDVGCGRGELLYDMAAMGYRHLTGVDPFIEQDIEYPGGPRVLRRTIHEVDGTFGLIMFHHSLEHIPDQLPTLQAAARLLAPGGQCLVRVPTVSSYAWEHYRENWVQLDAPRHFFLHSVRSLRMLAEQAGLRLVEIRYDSTDFQFAGSELYSMGIPFAASGGRFTRRQIREWKQRASELNVQQRGDQAAFYFRKA